MKKLFSVIVLMFCTMQMGFSQEDVITFSGTKHYKMSKADIIKNLVGKYCIYRPSEDGVWIDPDDGTTGLIVNEDGFTLVGNFAQTIYPARGTGNIDGSITDEARYYDGVWYEGRRNDGVIWYLLTRFKRSIDVMNFANAQWIGNNTINYDASNRAIILQCNPDGVWYYRCNMGDFPFKKSEIATDNVIEVVDAKSLQDSGLSVEEWAIGKWKAIITKEQRRADIIDGLECADYTLSEEEIEQQLTFYERDKIFYLEITKEYLQYQFPIPVVDGVGGVIETCNDFSIQHEYTIVDGKYGDYDIKVGDKIIASFGKYCKGISISIYDGFEIYGISLERVNELGEIETPDDAITSVTENVDVTNAESTDTQQSEKIASINEGQTGIEGYEWLEGEWEYSTEYDWAKVVITPTAYKMVNRNLNQGVEDILFELERPLSINYEYNYILDKQILVLDSENPLIGIDYEEQKVYVIVGEYGVLYLNKVNNGFEKYLKNISWVYGEWEMCSNNQSEKDYFVKITPFYYQISIDNVNSVEDKFAGQPKKQYRAKLGYDDSLGYCVYIDNFLLDLEAKRVYCVPGFEMKIPMAQTEEYTRIQIFYWIIIGCLGVGVLLCLYFLIRKLGSAIISFGKKVINAFIGAFRKN